MNRPKNAGNKNLPFRSPLASLKSPFENFKETLPDLKSIDFLRELRESIKAINSLGVVARRESLFRQTIYPKQIPHPNPIQSPSPKKRGRPIGSGGYRDTDLILLDEMQRLIDFGAASSDTKAAQHVAEKAAGGGTFESRVTRLLKAYRARRRGVSYARATGLTRR